MSNFIQGNHKMFTIQNLLDDAKCYEQVRQMRWPERVRCPHCESSMINKRGFHNRERHRQRYQCQTCDKQFDDLTQTIFEGHHQPLKVWLICLYLMGLNLSNQQIAQELGLNKDDVQAMTGQLRTGIVVKKRVLS
jgi:transposase-like protein